MLRRKGPILQRKKGKKPHESQSKATLKVDTLTNQPLPTNLNHNIDEQVKNLFDSFNKNLQNKITVYLDRVCKKNKSGVITEGRKLNLLNELTNSELIYCILEGNNKRI